MLNASHYVVHVEDGRIGDTTREDIRAFFDAFPSDPNRDRLVVHFHGGLVNQRNGRAIADRMASEYRAAGAVPLFFVWESGPVETVANVVARAAADPSFRALLVPVLKGLLDKVRGVAAGRGDMPQVDEAATDAGCAHVISAMAGSGRGFTEPFAFVPDWLPPDAALTASDEAAFLAALRADPAVVQARVAAPLVWAGLEAVAVGVLVRCIRRCATGRGHGIYATVVEELCRGIFAGAALRELWRLMKDSTARAFGPDPQRFGGTAVLEALQQMWGRGDRPSITLVGHSTGAIYICNWLTLAARWLPAGMVFDVVLLAPACTWTLLARTLAAHGDRVRGLLSFGMRDELERTDHLVPGLYPRSLLYFVSGVLEESPDEPLVGMQRFHAASQPVSRPGGFVWSPSIEEPGRTTLATRHDDFDNESVTLASVRHAIVHGIR